MERRAGTPASVVGLPGPREPAESPCPVHLAPGLWQVAGPTITHPWDAAAYLVVGRTALLVDCGSGLAPEALDRALLGCGVEVPALTGVLATHGHLDHVGDGQRLRGLGLPVLVHDGDAEAVRTGDPELTCAQSLYGVPFPAFEPQPVEDGDTIDLGEVRVEVLHTPGHTPGSLCVVVETAGRRVLLAGDTLWGGFSSAIRSDADDWQRSLHRLARLELDSLSFGHGITRLLDEPRARIEEAAERFGTYFDPWFKPPKRHFRF